MPSLSPCLEVLWGLPPVTTSLSLELSANACGDMWKHGEGHGVLEEGAFQGQSGQHVLPEQKAVTPVFPGFL